jgi:molybdenum cofactor biosynthesis protein B
VAPGGLADVARRSDEGADAIDTAFVLTISDGVTRGTRDDASGDALAGRLAELGFTVERGVVPDDQAAIAGAIVDRASRARLIVSTGGTGLGPRDVTPQAVRGVLDYEIPGLGEVMRAGGRLATPMADLSRSLAGVRERCLIVCVPGSVGGATDSLAAIEPVLEHALETIGGHTEHVGAEPGEG